VNAGGKLAPGTATTVGTLTVSATGGALNIAAAVNSTGSGTLVFDLDAAAASDRINLTVDR
jgi:hypothetical protein